MVLDLMHVQIFKQMVNGGKNVIIFSEDNSLSVHTGNRKKVSWFLVKEQ